MSWILFGQIMALMLTAYLLVCAGIDHHEKTKSKGRNGTL